MNKKMYIQPEMEIAQLAAMNIVCQSGEIDSTDEQITGQAPERKRLF